MKAPPLGEVFASRRPAKRRYRDSVSVDAKNMPWLTAERT
ncbi:hypothetical protein SAMN04488094_12720 [Tropicimonas isoalkanivorans]|uniref:Uncharacterized protein n=1 Tax=Tropicimonas isoalkanivorans TaxID=441112 RepID=A0A1I1R4C0_9RHOB|nr:hypothetical protein SAMN04488094_12720 [Tropicimonas isoalkanivorans]